MSIFNWNPNFQAMSNLLYYYGMCGLTKECLLQRYFSKVLENSHRFLISSWSIYRILLLCLWVFYFREFEAVDRPGSLILCRPVEEYVCHCHSCLHGEEAVLFFFFSTGNFIVYAFFSAVSKWKTKHKCVEISWVN